MKTTLALALAMALLASGTAQAAKKYYISVGCHPTYKLYRIGCDVGTPWKECAAAFCNTIVIGPGSGPGEARERAGPRPEPRLLAPLPPGVR
ncbi:MAG: hypothetical protein K9G59_12550 [Caulobacter sp.]|nr:hypothetical protein [Caulobacter sp.]